MMTEDDERFLRLPLSGSFCFRALSRLRLRSRPSVWCYFHAFFGSVCSRMIVCGRNLLQKVRKSLLFSRGCITFAHGSSKKRDVWTLFRLPLRDAVRRDGRVVDYSSLENCRTERYRGFESLSLRKVLQDDFKMVVKTAFKISVNRCKTYTYNDFSLYISLYGDG